METQENEESLKTPELLAPAGNWDCARAAVEAGADAIYFGVERLNARMRADNDSRFRTKARVCSTASVT